MGKSYVLLRWALVLIVLSWLGAVSVAADDEGCYCSGMTGNVNCDYQSRVSIGDIGLLVDHLFISHTRLPNRQEADVNCNGEINVADVAALTDHLYISHADLCDCPKSIEPNTAPETRIVGYIDAPFINWAEPGGVTTGVHMQWEGSDLVDHPYYPPDFEFEWQLLGPYADSEIETLTDSFVVQVFRLNNDDLIRFNQPWDTVGVDTIVDYYVFPPDTTYSYTILQGFFVVCDTVYEQGLMVIYCDTLAIDQMSDAQLAPYGVLDMLLRIEDDDFMNSTQFNRAVASSDDGQDGVWTYDTRDSLYNVFRNVSSDTTQQMKFLFWVRARDPVDPELYDPTPAYVFPEVIDPKFERDVLVVSFNNSSDEQQAVFDSARTYWGRAINAWAAHTRQDVDFEPDSDLRRHFDHGYAQGNQLLEDALKYKAVIITQDAAVSGSWSGGGLPVVNLQIAMLTGVNSWTAARVPIGNHPFLSQRDMEHADELYQYFWGVFSTEYSGWSYPLLFIDPDYRIEDFVGAFSQNPAGWPDLEIDSAALHRRYQWNEHEMMAWRPDLGALPEVNWAMVAGGPGVEVLYTYKSLYGDTHALDPTLSFQGRPVMQRVERSYFRSVHSLFTPVALEEGSAQVMVDSVMEYLYDPNLSQPVSGERHEETSGSMTSQQGRELYLQLRQQLGELYEAASKDPIVVDPMWREN